jgi:hypothetical protein
MARLDLDLLTLVGVPRPILQDAITALDNAITAFVGTYFDGVDCQVVEDVKQECNAAMWGLRAVIDPADDLIAATIDDNRLRNQLAALRALLVEAHGHLSAVYHCGATGLADLLTQIEQAVGKDGEGE